MIDQLIYSYRAQVYEWGVQQWKTFLKEEWRIVTWYFSLIVLPFGIYIFSVANELPLVMLFSFLLETVPLVLFDRYLVKHHARFLLNKQNRLQYTVIFLKSAIPNVSLYGPNTIDELVERLSERIDQRGPFENFLKAASSFTKSIILPIITFIAGVYSNGLEKISIDVVATCGLYTILLLGIIRLSWGCVSEIAKTLFCRNYTAAVSLRENLLDLKLIYFQNATKDDQ